MINFIFFILSFIPLNQNTNNLVNPYIKIDKSLFLIEKNYVSYDFEINRNLDRDGFNIYNTQNSLKGNYKYKYFSFSFDYENINNYFNYTSKDFKFTNNTEIDDLELYLGGNYYGFTLKGIFDFNFHTENVFNYGVYLDYLYNVNNFKYKIYYSKYEKQDSETSYLINQGDNFIFPYNYKKNYQIIGLDLIVNNFQLNFKGEFVGINTLDLEKKEFTIEETSKINKLRLDAKLDFKNYLVYFNYLEKIITADLKGEFDDTKYSKLIFKDYYDYTYNIGIKFKKMKKLDINFTYQSIESYFYGSIESWPFTNDASSWVGERLNFSLKPSYDRYILRARNEFSFFSGKFIVLPEAFYDVMIIDPSTTTYEAGFLGLGKQNENVYDEDIILNLLHLSASFIFYFYDFKLNLHVSQIIPIYFYNGNTRNNTILDNKTVKSEGFTLRFLIRYDF